MNISHQQCSIGYARSRSGSVLVTALLVLMVGTVGMASLTILLGNRSQYIHHAEIGIQRRLSINNGQALARHYFMRRHIAEPGTGAILDIQNGWGRVEIPATTTSAYATFQEFSLRNPFSPGDFGGFTENVTVALKQPAPYASGDISRDYLVQLKSRSPLLAGDLLVMHKPMGTSTYEEDVQGSIIVNGRTLFWTDDDIVQTDLTDFRTGGFDFPGTIGVSVKNLGGSASIASNFPMPPLTMGVNEISTAAQPVMDGRFNAIQIGTESATHPDPDATRKINTIHHKITHDTSPMVVDGSWGVTVGSVTGEMIPDDDGIGPDERLITINLNDTAVAPVMVNSGVHHLKLQGFTNSATANGEPATFILVRSPELETIELENNSYRRLVMGLQGSSLVEVKANNVIGNWRMLLSVEQTPLLFNLNTTLTIEGGIRTDARLQVATGNTLTLNKESQGDLLERMDPRQAWIEIYPPPPVSP